MAKAKAEDAKLILKIYDLRRTGDAGGEKICGLRVLAAEL